MNCWKNGNRKEARGNGIYNKWKFYGRCDGYDEYIVHQGRAFENEQKAKPYPQA